MNRLEAELSPTDSKKDLCLRDGQKLTMYADHPKRYQCPRCKTEYIRPSAEMLEQRQSQNNWAIPAIKSGLTSSNPRRYEVEEEDRLKVINFRLNEMQRFKNECAALILAGTLVCRLCKKATGDVCYFALLPGEQSLSPLRIHCQYGVNNRSWGKRVALLTREQSKKVIIIGKRTPVGVDLNTSGLDRWLLVAEKSISETTP